MQTRPPSPVTPRAADALALAVFDWIERGLIPTRSPVSDALESWAQCRFDTLDGTEIQKLREFAAQRGGATGERGIILSVTNGEEITRTYALSLRGARLEDGFVIAGPFWFDCNPDGICEGVINANGGQFRVRTVQQLTQTMKALEIIF